MKSTNHLFKKVDIGARGPAMSDWSNVDSDAEAMAILGNTSKFATIKTYTNLRTLSVHKLQVKNATHFPRFPLLSSLELRHISTADLSFIGAQPNLTRLWIWQSPKLRSLHGIEALPLEHLQLQEIMNVSSLAPLGELHGLKVLHLIGGMWREHSGGLLEPLLHLKGLEQLAIWAVELSEADFEVLCELKQLKVLDITTSHPLNQLARLGRIFPYLLDRWYEFSGLFIECKKCSGQKFSMPGKPSKMYCTSCEIEKIEEHKANLKRMIG